MITLREEVFVNIGGKEQKFAVQRQFDAFEWKTNPLWLQQAIQADLKRSLQVRVTERVSTITETKKFS